MFIFSTCLVVTYNIIYSLNLLLLIYAIYFTYRVFVDTSGFIIIASCYHIMMFILIGFYFGTDAYLEYKPQFTSYWKINNIN